jgi:phosphoserine phosphatase SerB
MDSNHKFKLVMFDMDGTLLNGRSIVFFANKREFGEELRQILQSDIEPYKKSIKIATFLKGSNISELLEIFRTIPLQENAWETGKKLKEKNIVMAIATDSYQFIVDDLKTRLNFDYAFANNLITEKNIVTGELILHNKTLKKCNNGRIYSICKGDVLKQLCNKLKIKPEDAIAIGDGIVDINMLSIAGLGIAYKAPEKVQKYADVVTNDLSVILSYI